jgi:hypothetical protein
LQEARLQRDKKMIFRIIALILCLAYSSFPAWDGDRRGFLLGFGLGPALELVETKTAFDGENASTGHLRSNFALLTDARIGYGINSRSLLFLSDFANWKKPGETIITLNSLLLEYNYFFRNQAPSFYMSLAGGYSWWLYPFDSYFNQHYSGNGFSASIGGGYEFAKHISVKLDLSESLPGYASNIPVTEILNGNTVNFSYVNFSEQYMVTSLRLTFCYFGY